MNRLFDYIRRNVLNGRQRNGKRSFALLFGQFQTLLELNNRVLADMAAMHSKLGGSYIFDVQYLRTATQHMKDLVRQLIDALDAMAPGKYPELYKSFREISHNIASEMSGQPVIPDQLVIPFEEIDHRDINMVGGKNLRLALVGRMFGLTVPHGFAVTTGAYLAFMEHNGLDEVAQQLEGKWRSGALSLDETSTKIRELILAGVVPSRLRKSLNRAMDALHQKTGGRVTGVAVRSSAWGEDGEYTFAGQYDSFLNVQPDGLHDAYRKVLASAYSPSAMEYRREHGFRADETLMAVSVQTMISAKASGVAYSLSPFNPGENSLLIAATWGLGSPVVSGRAEVDKFVFSRSAGHEPLSISIVRKEKAERLSPEGDVGMETVPEEMQTKASLSSEETAVLVEAVMRLERSFKKPLDVEFAFTEEGDLVVLQSRPLHVQAASKESDVDLSEILKNYEVLLTGVGDVAQQGVGAGSVFMADEGRSLEEFPDGAILVAHHSSPQFASVLHRCSGVITDVGSPLGHMATIAREYHVPALLNVGNATGILHDGDSVTLDAEQKTVYRGLVHELQLHEFMRERIDETHEYRLLRRLLKHIEPLNLYDPTAREFTPQGCKTYHDITRFIHEKAVEILLNIPNMPRGGHGCPGGRLELSVPLDLVVVDIGGGLECCGEGLADAGARRTVYSEQIVSRPLHAFLDGVTMEGVWQSTPVPVDFSSFMSSMTRTFSADMAGASVGQNLAVVSDRYLHLSLRLGYHFTMIDCFVGEDPADNYVHFRFAGGVTGATRRSRRARFLSAVLTKYDFRIKQQDDLVVARTKEQSEEKLLRVLCMLGVLVAYTRQLDVSMVNDAQISMHTKEFETLAKCLV